jgi:competence protein ComEC
MPPSIQQYPALRLAVLACLGIILGDAFEIPLTVPAAGVVVLSGAALVLFLRRGGARQDVALLLIVAVLGIVLGASKITFDRESTSALPDSLLGRNIVVVGDVREHPTSVGNRQRFVLKNVTIFHGDNTIPLTTNVLVSVRRSRVDTTNVDIKYGMAVGVSGSLSRPSAERNPGEFSARRFYEANGIGLFMLVTSHDHVVTTERGLSLTPLVWVMRNIISPVREFIISHIDGTIGGDEGEYLKGIFIGERSGIAPDIRQAFTNSGVAHVLAVSGSNVAVVALVLFLLTEFLRAPKWVRVTVTAIGLLGYMLITGSQPPVVRATIMALVLLIGMTMQQKPNVFNTLGLAALIILAIDARQLFDVGFQMSFAAVFAIVTIYPRLNLLIQKIPSTAMWQKAITGALRICAVSAAATLGTLPLTAVYFGRVSVVGLLANIVVIPAVGFSVVLGAISSAASLVSTWLAGVYVDLNYVVLHLSLALIEFAGALPFAYVDTLRFSPIDTLPFYAALAMLFQLKNPSALRRLLIILLVALNISVFSPTRAAYATADGRLRISFIDVGQGDAVLLEFPHGRTMLVDAGIVMPGYDAGERIVVPYLKRRGIPAIDLLVSSHPHADHIGGMPAVLRSYEVRKALDNGMPVESGIYRRYLEGIEVQQCEQIVAEHGTILSGFNGARVYVLHPFGEQTVTSRHRNINNSSAVLKVLYGNVSILLTGDVEMEAEAEIVGQYGDFLRSTLLKAPHHGSATSSTQQFLDMVQPVHAVISVGFNNKFGHPSPMVLDRFHAMDVSISRTDHEGAIIFETDGYSLRRIDWR